jgi:hypothetical protein
MSLKTPEPIHTLDQGVMYADNGYCVEPVKSRVARK